jgi:hypothetical protein
MTTLTDKFTEFETQVAAEMAAMALYVDTVEGKLQSVLDFLDIMNTNNAANTKALLAAMGQTGACFPCPTPSIVVPPVATNPITPNTHSCQLGQGIISTLHNILDAMDTLQSFNVVGSFNVINDAISQVIAAVAAGDTIPLPSFPETVNIVGNYVSYAGERVFSGVGLVEQFSPIEGDILAAIYAAEDPSAAQAAYNGVIDGSSVSLVGKLLFKAIAYNALWSYYYDPESTPDVSGFDGTLCGGTGCQTIASEAVSADDASFPELTPRQMIQISGWPSMNDSLFGTTFGEFVVADSWPGGGTLTLLSGAGARFVGNAGGAFAHQLELGVPYDIPSTVTNWFVDDVTAGLTLGGAYTLEYCPPEV